jgi:hypothetical protein
LDDELVGDDLIDMTKSISMDVKFYDTLQAKKKKRNPFLKTYI